MSVQLGPFEIKQRVAVGGMGEIWGGMHEEQNVPVAIKVITGPNALLPEFQDEFRREVQAVARLSHPNIVQVYDYGILADDVTQVSNELVPGSPYFVMEYASRGSLANQTDPINWRDLKNILMSVLGGLGHAHARGVIHRDIKPGNVLLGSVHETPPRIILTDFGVAHAADRQTRTDASEFTSRSTEEASGTPRYMAPEQFMGKWRDYGPWTDLYAVGIMAYELACGVLPFKGATFMMLAMAHINNPFPALKPRVDVPPGFEDWVRRMTMKSPHKRFQSAADAAWALTKLDDSNLLFGELSNIAGDYQDDFDDSTDMLPTRIDFALPEALRVFTMSRTSDQRTYEDAPAFPLTWHEAEPPASEFSMVGAGLGLFGLRAIPIVARSAEREAIWNEFKSTYLNGESRAVVLRGLSGTGKTRLGQWIKELADEIGAAVTMEASHGAVPGPTQGLAWMLTRHFRAAGLSHEDMQERIEEAFQREGVADEVQARALSEVMRNNLQQPDVGQTSRLVQFTAPEQRFGVIRKFIERESKYRPVLILLDDVQWSWESIEFVRHTLEQEDSHPIFFVLTVGEEGLAEQPDAARTLSFLLEHERAREIPVPPLKRSEIIALLEGSLAQPHDLAVDVARRSAGSPLFAIQLVEDWVKRGILVVEGSQLVVRRGERATVPTNLQQVWESRIAYLIQMLSTISVGRDTTSRVRRPVEPETARQALEIAATLGQDVNTNEWLKVCERSKLNVFAEMIDEMTRLRMATQTDDSFAFINAQLRDPLIRTAKESERWAAHNMACAQVLMSLYDEDHEGLAERVGRHFLEAGSYRLALTALQEAYRRAQNAPEHKDLSEINDLLEEAYRRMEIPESDSRWAELWVRRGVPMIYSEKPDVFETGLALLRRAEEVARGAGKKKVLANILRAQAWAAAQSGEFDEGLEKIQEAGKLVEHVPSLKAAVERTRGHVLLSSGDVEASIPCFERALELAPNSVHAVWARQQLAECAFARGDNETLDTMLDESLKSAREKGILLAEAATLEIRGIRQLHLGDASGAADDLREALSIRALVSGADSNLATRTRERLARAHLLLDELEDASKLLDQIARKLDEGARATGLHPADAQLLLAAKQRDWLAWDRECEAALRFEGAPGQHEVDTLLSAAEEARSAGSVSRAVDLYERLLELLDELQVFDEVQIDIIDRIDAIEDNPSADGAEPEAAVPEPEDASSTRETDSNAQVFATPPANLDEDSEPDYSVRGVQMLTAEDLANVRSPSSNSFFPFEPADGSAADEVSESSEADAHNGGDDEAADAPESLEFDAPLEDDLDASDVLDVLDQSSPLVIPGPDSGKHGWVDEDASVTGEFDAADFDDLDEVDELSIVSPTTGSAFPRVPTGSRVPSTEGAENDVRDDEE